MCKGDLALPAYSGVIVRESMHPTFSSRGRERAWNLDEVAVVVAVGVRQVGGFDVMKLQLLIDGELWWAGASHAVQVGG
jgi:hypothetical protein